MIDPLLVEFPDEISDEAIAKLVESLYALAGALENRYYLKLRRYYQDGDEADLPFNDRF